MTVVIRSNGVTHVRHPLTLTALCGATLAMPAAIERAEQPACLLCRVRLASAKKIVEGATPASQRSPARPVTSVAVVDEQPELVDVDLRCGVCSGFESRRVCGADDVPATLAALVCQRCGEIGRMRLAPAVLDEEPEPPSMPEVL